MGKISAGTHRFHRGNASPDRTCLFWSFLSVTMPRLIEIFGNVPFERDLMVVLNGGLRVLVADYIRRHHELHDMVLNSGTKYKTVEEYCSAIEQVDLLAGEPELNALSSIYNIIICKIDLMNITSDNRLKPSYYGEDNRSATQCVYIYYNGKDHFDPLYVVNMENPDEKETMFDPNDEMINGLLSKFIKEKLHYDGDVELGVHIVAYVNEVSHPADGSNETDILSNSILLNTPTKRKAAVDHIPMSSNSDIQLPTSISENYCVPNKRIKTTEVATDRMSRFYKNNSETITTDRLLQVENVRGETDLPVNQQEIEDIPMVLNDEHQEEKVEGAKEPDNKSVRDIQDNDNSESLKTKSLS